MISMICLEYASAKAQLRLVRHEGSAPSLPDAVALANVCRKTPGLLFANAAVLYALAPAAVYFIPDNSNWLIAAQVLSPTLDLHAIAACVMVTYMIFQTTSREVT